MNRFRKIISYTFFVVVLVFTSSCEKVLEKTPDGTLTLDQVLADYDKTKGLLSSAYSQMITRTDNLFFFQTQECLTDNAFEAREDGYSSYWWHTGQLSTTNGALWPSTGMGGDTGNANGSFWKVFWKGIRLSNIAIKYIPQSSIVSDLEKAQWIDQAKLLRAYYYFQLISLYGPLPYVKEPFDPTFADWATLVRPTYQEVNDEIIAECDEVINNDNIELKRPSNEKSLLPMSFAYALKSRALLYNASELNNPNNDREKWQAAADAAEDVIGLSGHSLLSIDNYDDLYTTPFTTDISEILYKSHADNSHLGNVNGVSLASYGLANCHKCGEVPTQEMVDCFEMTNGSLPVTYTDDEHLNVTINSDAASIGYGEGVGENPYLNRDKRFYYDILYNGADFGIPTGVDFHAIIDSYVGGGQGFNDDVSSETKFSCTGYYSRKSRNVKYYGPQGLGNGVAHHMIYFRLAEFYLNYAEALCELGDLPGALTQLNVIRNRAEQPKLENVSGFQNTQEYIRERIRNERRVELFLENHRYYDQRRWKILDQTNKVVTGMRITKGTDDSFTYSRVNVYNRLSFTDKYLILPIMQDEAKKIPGIGQPDAWK